MEKVRAILVICGIGFFVLAFALMGLLPILTLSDLPTQKLIDISPEVPDFFHDLASRYPQSFARNVGEPSLRNYHDAVRRGREIYVAEGCWHCHSQYVRPVSNEGLRFGEVSVAEEYQNEMQQPVLFGTRRVGPDLTREFGKRTNDWHAAHFYEPRNTSPVSVMPSYQWFFDPAVGDAAPVPNADGLAIISYVQWLGSWKRPLLRGERQRDRERGP
jgi:hypothetical protein